MLRLLAIVLATVVLCAVGRASYLEEDAEVGPPERVPPPVPPPAPGNPLTRLVSRLSVGPEYSYRGLTVFPLQVSRTEDLRDYRSMQEALSDGTLIITEKGAGSVPVVLAENRGSRHVLLLAGEVIAGGKQNRVLREDVLLAPKSGLVELPVYCVEQGRWSGRDVTFDKNPSVAALSVREAAQSATSSQAEVWDRVSLYHRSAGTGSPTSDLQALHDAPQVREAVEEYRAAFRERWPRQTVGMVVARFGRIVGCDLFCNERVFQKHRDRLIESYAVDCYAEWRRGGRGQDEPARWPVPGRAEVERFLRRTYEAQCTWRPTPGSGRVLVVEGAGLSGTGLAYEDALLHAALFPQDAVIMSPPPVRPLPEGPPRPIPGPRL